MGRKIRDLTKEGPFGRLTATHCLGRRNGKGNAYFSCKCECGNRIEVSGNNLVSGGVKSCGCLQSENGTRTGLVIGGWNKKHVLARTRIHNTWTGMISRCCNPSSDSYTNYGARGITVCERWQGDAGFESFCQDMGERPKDMSLDRIDNDKGYSPDNCRWATKGQQNRNKRTNVYLTFGGETLTMKDWALRIGLSYKTLERRRRDGWSVERMLTQPVQTQNHEIDETTK